MAHTRADTSKRQRRNRTPRRTGTVQKKRNGSLLSSYRRRSSQSRLRRARSSLSKSKRTGDRNVRPDTTRPRREVRRALFTENEVRDDSNDAALYSTSHNGNSDLPLIGTELKRRAGGRSLRRSLRVSLQGTEQAQLPNLIPGVANKDIQEAFVDVFTEARLERVELDQCVSIESLRVRPLNEFGIQKAMDMLRGGTRGLVTGYVHVGKFPLVVELPGSYRQSVLTFFDSKGRDREQTENWIGSRPTYHVVNGGHEHEARWRIAAANGWAFGGLKWRVMVIPWPDPNTLRSIAMMSNQLQKKDFFIEMSFMDEIIMLRRIIEEFILAGEFVYAPGKPLQRGFPEKVAAKFGGGHCMSNTTVKALVSVAVKCSMSTLEVMKSVVDREVPEVAQSLASSGQGDASAVYDVRAFRKLLNSKSLRRASSFLGPKFSDEDRRNALLRLCSIAVDKGTVKGVSGIELDRQATLAMAARGEIEKFEMRILPGQEWPSQMRDIKRNLLETQKMDAEVKENATTPDRLLKSIRNLYISLKGPVAATRVEQYERLLFNPTSSNSADRRSNQHTDSPGEAGLEGEAIEMPEKQSESPASNAVCEEISPGRIPDLSNTEETTSDGDALDGKVQSGTQVISTAMESRSGDEQPEEDLNLSLEQNTENEGESNVSVLEQCQIEVHSIEWDKYELNSFVAPSSFDFMYGDPYQSTGRQVPRYMSAEELHRFVEFSRKILTPGGYMFIVCTLEYIKDWKCALEAIGMCRPHVFHLLWDSNCIQRTKGRGLQCPVEVAIVARKPGSHPKKFSIDVDSPYTHLPNCSFGRKYSVIDGINQPPQKLYFPSTKVPMRNQEKPHALLWEIMTTFCPPGGES